MMRRVSQLSALGEVDVLSPAQCQDVRDAVLALRADWTHRSPDGLFCTLGVNAYMDLARAPHAGYSYFGPARGTNLLLKQQFAGVHGRLAEVLEQELGLPVRYADDLAMPGFHIWVGRGIPRRSETSVHFDLQYKYLLTQPGYARASGTVSFTLPVALPAGGSSLRVWPCMYPGDLARVAAIQQTEPEAVPYHPGCAVVHTGHVLHQIGATPTAQPDDLRITLQGHGLVVDGSLILYW